MGLEIPVIDIFAGPGGLGEGFASLRGKQNNRVFKHALSIEADQYAHRTLLLRSFYRQFDPGHAPKAYYRYLESDTGSLKDLLAAHRREGDIALREAWKATLGETAKSRVDARITDSLAAFRKREPWVLLGGPPCQAYSLVGRARMLSTNSKFYKDRRHRLYRHYLRLLADHKPAVFVFENVKGLLSAASSKNGDLIFERILTDLKSPSRDVKYRLFAITDQDETVSLLPAEEENWHRFIVESEKFGIPQARHRVIILGVLESDFRESSVRRLAEIKQKRTCYDVTLGVPPVRSGLSDVTDTDETWLDVIRSASKSRWFSDLKSNGGRAVAEKIHDVVQNASIPKAGRGGRFVPEAPQVSCNSDWYIDPQLTGTCNHQAKSHMQSDIHRYIFCSCYGAVNESSPKLRDFPEDLLPKHLNVDRGISGSLFSDRFRVQLADRPATTITSHLAKDGHYFIHWDPTQCRSFTVREAARLQTFPDNYFFEGPRTEQYRQVGNAVPPLLAREIAKIVADLLVPGW